jgi:hypothetical protein
MAKSKPFKSTYDPARKRWVRTDSVEFVHYEVPEGERPGGEGSLPGWGPTHMLTLISKRGTNRVFSMELSEMTAEELDATKEMLDKVFAEARPICEYRDKKAREAFDEGDDSHYRLYRQVPGIFER